VKFNDADLIGMPVRVTIGDKSLKEGKVEVKLRSSEHIELVAVEDIVTYIKKVTQMVS